MLRRPSNPSTQVIVVAIAVLTALANMLAPGAHQQALAQDPTPPAQPYADAVAALIARMSVQQRVGQLFVVSFPGDSVDAQSEIADLVTNYRIGGVQIRAANRNFSNDKIDPPVTQQVARMANALQSLAILSGSVTLPGEVFVAPPTRIAPTGSPTSTIEPTITPTVAPNQPPPAIPLFIALSQDADAAQGRVELGEITQGLTPIPSELAIGATWNPANAQSAGEIVGSELSQLGVNVLFGPTLDVVDSPKPNTPGDFGTQVFGGDPFWVGKLGNAFVTGVHRGSKNRLAVIAKNFPGLGASDRDVREEIPTVQKSIEQLRQIELAPFFAVMRGDVAKDSTVDGLLVSHIRYRGFQGNIRASTRPVSFDPQAYSALMALPEIAAWRATGGVTFSDSLGARSVRRFYDPLEASFNARRIAQEAFVAGNDVLVLGNFGQSNNWDEQLANIKDAIRFFQTKYQEDPNFAARVDQSLARILSLKLRLFGGAFDIGQALVDEQAVAVIQPQTNIIAGIAKESITLLSPNSRDLATVLPNQPTKDESIVFITDDRNLRDCAQCTPYPAVGRTTLEDIALNLYGPRTTGQVDPSRVSSFTFSELAAFNLRMTSAVTDSGTPAAGNVLPTPSPTANLGEPTDVATSQPRAPDIGESINRAQWIVISMIDTSSGITSTEALRTFLSQSADALRDKRVVVFALGAPYYLDATEISKVTAYYGVYSRSQVFLEAALRALFGEFAPQGDSPVSVPGMNYALISQTAPDPNQIIPISTGDVVTDTQATPAPLELKIGDRLKLRAGPILDLNGHVVPDDTQVQFILSYPNERVEQPQEPIFTRDGIAETTIAIERKGKINIRAEADPAVKSSQVVVDINDTVSIEIIKPTALPTNTPQPTATADLRPTQEANTAGSPLVTGTSGAMRASLPGFVITFFGLMLVGMGLFGLLTAEKIETLKTSARLRVVIALWMAGWLAYVLVAMGLPGTRWLTNTLGWGGSVVAAIIIAIVGAGIIVAAARFSMFVQNEK